MKYIITTPGERTITVEAQNSTQAKRIACKYLGIKPSDKWCGVSSLTAKIIKEVKS